MAIHGISIAKGLNRTVCSAIRYFSGKLLCPVITGNSINSRYGTSKNSSMTNRCKRRKVTDHGILTGKTIIDQPFKTPVSIAIIVIDTNNPTASGQLRYPRPALAVEEN